MSISNIEVEIFVVYSSTTHKKKLFAQCDEKSVFYAARSFFKIIQEIEAFEFKIKVKVCVNVIYVWEVFFCCASD